MNVYQAGYHGSDVAVTMEIMEDEDVRPVLAGRVMSCYVYI